MSPALEVDRRPQGSGRPVRRLPGEDGLWVLIFGDLMVFGLFFVTFFFYRNDDLDAFRIGHAVMDIRLGVLNTILLLTSSWFVASATRRLRLDLGNAPLLIAGAIACGVGFVIVKAFEYTDKIRAGFTLNSSDFFRLYFMYTGIHLMHVLIGVGVLTLMFLRCRQRGDGLALIRFVEGGGSFWHLVDLLWIVIFPIFYLVR